MKVKQIQNRRTKYEICKKKFRKKVPTKIRQKTTHRSIEIIITDSTT